MKRNIAIKLIIAIVIVFCIINSIYGSSDSISSAKEEFKVDDLVDTLEEYTDNEYDLQKVGEDLITGKGLNYGILGNKIIDILTKEIYPAIKGMISILVIITLMAILKSLELDEDSSVNKVVYLISFLVITLILIITYKDILSMFTSSINLMTKVVQAVSPFVMAILMATGCITTTGIIQPLILFMASAIGVVVNYVIIPVLVISLVLKILSSMSDFINLNKFASVISKTAMWITGIAFTLMLGILGIDSSIGTSVDSVTVKTAQTAVSSTIPVVGKFVSDSLEVIMGSAEVIGKVAGTVGIVSLILVMLNPIIKLIVLILIYLLLAAFAESLGADKKIVELITSFSTLYKTMLGVLIGVMSIFLISIAIMMSLMGKVTS